MKTSLNLSDDLFKAARREARKHGRTLSETISEWARTGRKGLRKEKSKSRPFCPVDLSGPSMIDLNCRRDWMDTLDRDRS